MYEIKIFKKTKPIIALIFLRFLIEVIADCGLPAIPVNTIINEIKSKYNEGFKCEYKCEFEELSLIGGQFRTCVNGRWDGYIPRCVQKVRSESITQLEVSDNNNNHKNYSYQNEIISCIKSDVNQYKSSSQKLFLRFDKIIRHIVYFEIDFYMNHNNSLNIIRAHTNDIRGCTHEKLDASYNSSLMRYGFRCDMKFEGQEAYAAWDRDQTLGLTIEFYESIVTLCNLSVYHETYTRYHWCGTNEQPLNSESKYFTGSEQYREVTFYKYSCVDGFELMGNIEVRCSASNHWLDDFPICVPNQTYCELHPTDSVNINKGYRVNYENIYNFNYTSYAIKGSLAIYSCADENHVLIGDSVRICDINGNWIGVEPFCSAMNKLNVEMLNKTQETNTGLEIYENFDTNSDGLCGIPSIPLYSRLVDPKSLFQITKPTNLRPFYTNGSKVMYYCESTYKWIYDEHDIKQCIDGQWIGNESSCFVNWEEKMMLTSIEVEGKSGEIVNKYSIRPREEVGEWDYLYSYYRDITQDECKPTIQIDTKQKWIFHFNGSQVITYIIMNLSPSDILNISSIESNIISAEVGGKMCEMRSFDNSNSMTALAFDCSKSIDLMVDEIVIYFNPQNSIAQNVSLCLLNVLYNSKLCGKPDEPINSIVKFDQKSGVASYSCVSGYELIGNSVIHCGSEGKWKGMVPKCVSKELCSMTSNDKDLAIEYLNTESFNGRSIAKHKTIALYSCQNIDNRTDLKLIGSKIRMCLLSGQWSGSQPICKSAIISPNDENLIGDQESTSNASITIIIIVVLLVVITAVVYILKTRYDVSISSFANYLRFR